MTEEMTDHEIREHIAVNVMGWHTQYPYSGEWSKGGIYVVDKCDWNPLTNYADGMAAWKIVAKDSNYNSIRYDRPAEEWDAYLERGEFDPFIERSDRHMLRAMCLCMVAATRGRE